MYTVESNSEVATSSIIQTKCMITFIFKFFVIYRILIVCHKAWHTVQLIARNKS